MAQDNHSSGTNHNATHTDVVGVTAKQRENMGIAIAVVSMFLVLLIAAQTELDEAPTRSQIVNVVDVNPSVSTP